MGRSGTAAAQPARTKPPWWLYLALYVAGVLVLALLARQVPGPLDIDGAYYLLVGRNVAQGRGLVIDAIWHYFRPAAGWPQPAGDLWMPLPSLLLVPALLLRPTFGFAQGMQVLLAALLPLLSFQIAHDEGAPRGWALLAGLATLLAGTAAPHWVDTDCYTAYALFGGAALYAAGRAGRSPRWLIAAGALGGLAALTRNDGLLLLAALWSSALLFRESGTRFPWRPLALGTALFSLPVLAWGLRNLAVFGRASAVPLALLLTLRDYGQLFAYLPEPDWTGFWAQGLAAFWTLRRSAVQAGLVVLLGNLQVWQALPLLGTALGLRRRPALGPAFLYLALLFPLLVLALPLLVLHGTWSRSLGAFLPTGYAAMALGLHRLAERLCAWRPALPRRLLHGTLLLLAGLLTVGVGLLAAAAQLQSARVHPETGARIGAWLQRNSAPDEVVMARDPMAVLLYGERRAVGLPEEELPRLLEIARAYGVGKLVLAEGRGLPPALEPLYAAGASWGPFTLLWREGDIQVYALDPAAAPDGAAR